MGEHANPHGDPYIELAIETLGPGAPPERVEEVADLIADIETPEGEK